MFNHIPHTLQQHGSIVKVQVLESPCSPDLWLIKNVAHYKRLNMTKDTLNCWWKPYIMQEKENHCQNYSSWSQLPNAYKVLLKEQVVVSMTLSKHLPLILTSKRISLLQQLMCCLCAFLNEGVSLFCHQSVSVYILNSLRTVFGNGAVSSIYIVPLRESVFHTFNNQLLLILNLQAFQCVIFIVQKGEVVL